MVLIHHLAGDSSGLEEWRSGLKGEALLRYNGAGSSGFHDALNTLQQFTALSEPDTATRVRLVAAFLSDPPIATHIRTSSGMPASIVGILRQRGLLNEEEFLNHGMAIAEASPYRGHVRCRIREAVRAEKSHEAGPCRMGSGHPIRNRNRLGNG